MKIQKSFVKTNETASLRCPECSLVKNIAVGKFRIGRHTLKTRCSCGTTFMVALDFRRHYRKTINIVGLYTLVGSSAKGGGQMRVHNISRSGVGFSVSGQHDITIGQKALINFKLNDKKKTELTKKILVKSVRDNYIGCEFINQKQISKELGFFLQP